MKKLPYETCFVVMKLNGSIEKIFFSKVENYGDYLDFSFDNHLHLITGNTLNDDDEFDDNFIHCCQMYLNTKEALMQFKIDAKNKCFLKSEMCAYLEFDTKVNHDELIIDVLLRAYDENQGVFNEIASLVSDEAMECFVKGLSMEQQDLLFEIV